MKHVVLIGFMGSGKTRVGKKVAQDLDLPFVDVDKVIAKKMRMTKKEIFDHFGEPFYRALETRELKELLVAKEKKVVSVGSGLPLQEQNVKYLKELGTIIYLKGSFATIWKRIQGSYTGENQEERLRRLLAQRDPIYAAYADIVAVTGVKPFESLVAEIEEKLKDMPKNS